MDGTRKNVRSFGVTEGTNLGLWLDRYVGMQKHAPGEDKGAAQREFEKRRSQALSARADAGYAAAVKRREAHLRQLDGGFTGGVTRIFTATALGRLAVGLGQASVWENNVSLSRTWGTPVIPGSALKGLASSYAARNGDAEQWAKPSEADGKKGASQALLFGDLQAAGEVTFHDAWWIGEKDSQLVDRDVMTVHHQAYYSRKPDAPADRDAPADWDEPNPVGFFTTRGAFLVALSGPADAVAVAADLLERALKDDGVGAKTHAGYGRMSWVAKLSDEEALVEAERKRLADEAAALERRLASFAVPMPADKAPAELATRFQQLFREGGELGEAQQREVVRRLAVTNKAALDGWQKKDRPGAELVRAVLAELRVPAVGTTVHSPVPVVRETARREIVAKLRVKGKDVFFESLGEGVACKRDQKAGVIAGKSPDADRQKVFLKALLERGDGVYGARVVVELDGDKIKTVDFVEGGTK